MSSNQSISTDKQHRKPDEKARKSTKCSRFTDENSAIAAADAQGGELMISEPRSETADKHDKTTDALGTIPDTLSGQNELIDEPDGITKKKGGNYSYTYNSYYCY